MVNTACSLSEERWQHHTHGETTECCNREVRLSPFHNDRGISHVAWSYYLLNIRPLSSLLAGTSKQINLRGADHQHNEGILYCS